MSGVPVALTLAKSLGTLRHFLEGQASGGIVLMASMAIALIVANSPFGYSYEHLLHARLGLLSYAASVLP